MPAIDSPPAMTSLPLAAAALKMSWGQAYKSLLAGELTGVLRGSRWLVTKESVLRLARERSNSASDLLSPESLR